MRRTHLRGRFCQPLDFVSRPSAETVPIWIIAPPHFFALAADKALGVQAVIAAVEPMELEFELPSIVRTSNHATLPKPIHDLTRLFR